MPHDADQPLTLRDPTLADVARRDTWPERLPVVGGFFHFYAMAGRLARASSEVDALLSGRAEFPADAWRAAGIDPAVAEPVAHACARLIVREHPNHYYRPDDPLWLLMLDPENMALLEASWVCKERFGRSIDPRTLPALEAARFIDLVQAVTAPAA